MLKIRSLQAGYGNLKVLKNVSMHVAQGEIVTIIGANGAGKATLLSTISGLLRPTAGTILFEDQDITRLAAPKIPALGCVMVPEGRQIFAALSVEENLILGGHVRRQEGKAALERQLARQYELFPILKERRTQYAGTLSGGEQQMLAMGRALMSRPSLIMMDEPSTGLAPLIVQDIFKVIVRMRDEGKTVGRIDSRYTGIDRFRDGDAFESDPSMDATMGIYTSALNAYMHDELEYESDLPYEILSSETWQNWDYEDFKNAFVDVSETLRNTMTRNRHMKVFIANGYLDLATPYYATEYTFNHLGLDASLHDNVAMEYYDAGHMMYVHIPSLEKLAEDMRSFVRGSS